MAVLAAVLTVPAAASAVWSATASGSSAVPTGSLAAPGTTTVSWDPTVHVRWSASSSDFAAGYRVSRSVSTSGPWTQVADVPAGTTTIDDTPGAGTWHYRVNAYRGSWTSPSGPVATRNDPTYVVRAATTEGPGCPSLSRMYTMQQGFVPSGTGVSSPLDSGNPTRFCTDAFTSGQSLAAGKTTITAFISHSTNNGKPCGITLGLSVNALTSLTPSGAVLTRSVPSGTTTASPQTWTVDTIAYAFAPGDLINIRLTPDGNCGSSTHLHVAGSSTRTRVTFPG